MYEIILKSHKIEYIILLKSLFFLELVNTYHRRMKKCSIEK